MFWPYKSACNVPKLAHTMIILLFNGTFHLFKAMSAQTEYKYVSTTVFAWTCKSFI